MTVTALATGDVPPFWALIAVAGLALYLLVVAPWPRTWGAGRHEIDAALLGDGLVPRCGLTMTRAVTIDAPVAVVWSWLIGQDRTRLIARSRAPR